MPLRADAPIFIPNSQAHWTQELSNITNAFLTEDSYNSSSTPTKVESIEKENSSPVYTEPSPPYRKISISPLPIFIKSAAYTQKNPPPLQDSSNMIYQLQLPATPEKQTLQQPQPQHSIDLSFANESTGQTEPQVAPPKLEIQLESTMLTPRRIPHPLDDASNMIQFGDFTSEKLSQTSTLIQLTSTSSETDIRDKENTEISCSTPTPLSPEEQQKKISKKAKKILADQESNENPATAMRKFIENGFSTPPKKNTPPEATSENRKQASQSQPKNSPKTSRKLLEEFAQATVGDLNIESYLTQNTPSPKLLKELDTHIQQLQEPVIKLVKPLATKNRKAIMFGLDPYHKVWLNISGSNSPKNQGKAIKIQTALRKISPEINVEFSQESELELAIRYQCADLKHSLTPQQTRKLKSKNAWCVEEAIRRRIVHKIFFITHQGRIEPAPPCECCQLGRVFITK